MDISGRSAVVTGAASGIGRAIAHALAARGARVLCADIAADGGAETVAGIVSAGGEARFERCDVTRSEDLERTFAAAIAAYGGLDIVCNNAGVGGESIFDDESGAWRRMVDINLVSVLDGTRLAVRELRSRGGGVVINTASMGGLLPMPAAPVYAATKAAVIHFTRSLAHLADECGVRVNAVCPSYADTPLIYRVDNVERVEVMKERLGGLVHPDEVALGVVELIEDDTRAGAIMRVTVRGGRDFAREIRP